MFLNSGVPCTYKKTGLIKDCGWTDESLRKFLTGLPEKFLDGWIDGREGVGGGDGKFICLLQHTAAH